MDEPTDYVIPMKWMSWDEVCALYGPPDTERMGRYEGFILYRSGERESPQAAEMRGAMEEVRDDDGRLVGLVPKGYRPSCEERMRSIDLMMEMAR